MYSSQISFSLSKTGSFSLMFKMVTFIMLLFSIYNESYKLKYFHVFLNLAWIGKEGW